eukprot:g5254.t1
MIRNRRFHRRVSSDNDILMDAEAKWCLAQCDRNRRCTARYVGYTYTMCQRCDDLTARCPLGVQDRDECKAGCKLVYPDGGSSTSSSSTAKTKPKTKPAGIRPGLTFEEAVILGLATPKPKPAAWRWPTVQYFGSRISFLCTEGFVMVKSKTKPKPKCLKTKPKATLKAKETPALLQAKATLKAKSKVKAKSMAKSMPKARFLR